MYVQLLVSKPIEQNGKMIHYKPGDWVEVGKQSALAMIANGEAIIPNQAKLASMLPADCAVLLTHDYSDVGKLEKRLTAMSLTVEQLGPLGVWAHYHVLVAEPAAIAKPDLIPAGFYLLEKWPLVVPLASYTKLAANIGTKADRDLTVDIIRDLRVPYYDTRMVFMRKCPDTMLFWDEYQHQRKALKGKTDERLAFLRALYTVKPIVCALPIIWAKGSD